MKKQSGITLIALIITIIVLLILAGVSISMALGDNGILTRSEYAKERHEYGTAKEIIELKVADLEMEKIVEKNKDGQLQYIANGLHPNADPDIEYVDVSTRVSTSSLNIDIGEATRIYVKLRAYKYEFEIDRTGKIVKAKDTETKEVVEESTSNDDNTEDIIIQELTLSADSGSTSTITVTIVEDTELEIPENAVYNYYLKLHENEEFPAEPAYFGTETTYTFDSEDGVTRHTPHDIKVTITDSSNRIIAIGTLENIYPFAGCFVAGTQISTSEGLKNIEDLKVDDLVLTYNFETEKVEEKKILKTFIFDKNEIYNIILKNGEILQNTETHPYYVIGKGWTETKYLEIGNKVITQENEEIEIVNIEIKTLEESIKVYNIEVADNHNYFVGKSKILVHNKVCVFPDSEIATSLNGDYILAKDIKIKDNIVYYNFETQQKELGKVADIQIHVDATDFVTYRFEDGTILQVTDYHPIYTKEGWKSYTQHKGYEIPKVGDEVQTENGWKKISSIEKWTGLEDCYDFAVENAEGEPINNYYANGILVQSSLVK